MLGSKHRVISLITAGSRNPEPICRHPTSGQYHRDLVLQRPKAKTGKVLILKFPHPTNRNSCVNRPSEFDEEKAYCEKFLRLADKALESPPKRELKDAS